MRALATRRDRHTERVSHPGQTAASQQLCEILHKLSFRRTPAASHPSDSAASPSPRRRLRATHPQRSNLAHGRRSPLLKSGQFSFAFVPLAAGRDPSTSNPAPGRPTHPHNTILISSLPALRHPTCMNDRPRSCLAVLNSDRDPLTARLAELCSSDPER